MSTVNQDELKAIKVLKFEGKESEWERVILLIARQVKYGLF